MTAILPIHIVPLKAKTGSSSAWYALEFKLISAAERDPLGMSHPDDDPPEPPGAFGEDDESDDEAEQEANEEEH